MMDPVRELKVRAEILHRGVQAQEPAAVERLRALPEHRRVEPEALREIASHVQRKHCLAVVAREVGFAGWDHARRVFEGDAGESDFGKMLYGAGCGGQLNHWFATYEEARAFHVEHRAPDARSYLLAYQRHFFVADRHFIEALGLDPDDADWTAIGWDWARPRSVEARSRLYAKILTPRAG
jgi:hypothetical protein